MKKVLAMMMAAVMLLTLFAGCGQVSEIPTTDGDQSPVNDEQTSTVDQSPVNDEQTSTVDQSLSDQADSDMAYVQDKGKLVVGITDYAPMDYKDENGEWIGFDAEFARLFAKELNVDVEFFVIADWGQKFYELETKNIDVIWNGMTINDDVLLNTSCSDPYVLNAQVLVMKADKISAYTDAESLKGLSIACEQGSVAEDVLTEIGVTDYITVENQEAALLEVKAGTSEACVVDITMARAMTGEGTNYADLSAGIPLSEEEYGVGFRKGSDMTAKLNELIAKWMADGTMDALAQKYSLTLAE